MGYGAAGICAVIQNFTKHSNLSGNKNIEKQPCFARVGKYDILNILLLLVSF